MLRTGGWGRNVYDWQQGFCLRDGCGKGTCRQHGVLPPDSTPCGPTRAIPFVSAACRAATTAHCAAQDYNSRGKKAHRSCSGHQRGESRGVCQRRRERGQGGCCCCSCCTAWTQHCIRNVADMSSLQVACVYDNNASDKLPTGCATQVRDRDAERELRAMRQEKKQERQQRQQQLQEAWEEG